MIKQTEKMVDREFPKELHQRALVIFIITEESTTKLTG